MILPQMVTFLTSIFMPAGPYFGRIVQCSPPNIISRMSKLSKIDSFAIAAFLQEMKISTFYIVLPTVILDLGRILTQMLTLQALMDLSAVNNLYFNLQKVRSFWTVMVEYSWRKDIN